MAVNTSKEHREELIWAFGGYIGGRYGTIDKEKALTLLKNTKKPGEIIDIDHMTLLHWAARNGWADISRQLVEIHHVNPHVKDSEGSTALYYACNSDHTDIVQYLVNSAHCDPLIKDIYGRTPFDVSKRESRDFLQDIIDEAWKEGLSVVKYTKQNQKHFLESMGECKEEITQLNIMLHGPPGVGKTSLSRVILGEQPLPKEERNSTKIMEPPVRAIKADQLNEFEGQFEKISEEKLIHLIAEFLKNRKSQRDAVQLANRQGTFFARVFRRINQPTSDNQRPIPAKSTSTVEALNDINVAFPSAQPSSKMFDSKWLNLIDSGGQPQFQDMLPLLFKGPSFQIVVMRLTELGLEDKPEMCYTVGGENIVRARDDLHLTNLQYIERACQIAAAANPPSKVMIIGTHKDELEKKGVTSATLVALEKGLEHVRTKYQHVIYSNKGNAIFPMNTLAEDEDERKGYTKEMQDAIEKVIDDLAMPQPIPLRWFVFQLALRSQASAVIRKDACLKLGNLLGMGKDAVEKALIFFNQSAFLLYYPDAIADLVLTKVDPIIERLSQIVITTFQVPPQLQGFSHLCTKLAEKGLFDAAFCDKLFKDAADFTDGLTNQEFLKLLVALRLAVLVDEKEQLYFLPSALSYLLPTAESAVSKDACGFILEDVKKEVRILPHGFYFTSVVELLSNKNQFEISGCNQYRNQIQVRDKSRKIPGVVILSDKTWWIQVSHSMPELLRKNPLYCLKICMAVKKAIDLAKKQLKHTAVASITKVFPCPVAGHSDHYCTITEDSKCYTCSSDPDMFAGSVTEDMMLWMEGSSFNQLTTPNMFNLLQDKSAQWSNIGRAFDVSDNDRDTLRRDPSLTDKDRLEKVLSQWLQSTSPRPTWALFRNVITDKLKFYDVAEQVSDMIS